MKTLRKMNKYNLKQFKKTETRHELNFRITSILMKQIINKHTYTSIIIFYSVSYEETRLQTAIYIFCFLPYTRSINIIIQYIITNKHRSYFQLNILKSNNYNQFNT